MRWFVLLLLCSCTTTIESRQSYCQQMCDDERNECMDRQSQFLEYCEKDYNNCVEYCY